MFFCKSPSLNVSEEGYYAIFNAFFTADINGKQYALQINSGQFLSLTMYALENRREKILELALKVVVKFAELDETCGNVNTENSIMFQADMEGLRSHLENIVLWNENPD